ncbi:secretogranin-2b [Hippoglossus hippoglossus]|uniref:secretogranin-2b n=1 Tax=Hippoglossus hippoglossus TaxID=8267 RepID=UPI00148D94D1|nr:secretogranin-2b [Hippoglossus hippoglossus]XP_034469870.1 secretogranin-2b [Hippoglossus hippoglossus]XP_035026501.1 secretogranin-2b [Hippoglossus stenolepis]XP_035026502.1 secretogranin-2b [Hippoglossus stenolepis]
MLHFHHKLPTGGAVVLLAFLLHGCAVQAASLPRHFRLRGGESEGQPAAYPPSPDMMKALEYIENLKQRNGGRPEPADYDEVDKFKILLQLAAQQDESPGDRQPAPGAQRQDITAEQLMKALLKSLQDQAGREAKLSPAPAPRNDRRTHRHRTKDTEVPQSAPSEYGNFPRPHKKYPLMFEDEENTDASKRATEDLDEQYTPQSLANLRSIFEELGRMPTLGGQKRDLFGDDDDEEEDGFSLRSPAYEDVAGGEEWVPVEEREETEEMVNGSHEEMARALGEQEEAEREEMQRRANQNQEGADDDTKLVDYYLLKVLEMSDQTQKREKTGEQRKRLIRPSIVDPRTVRELLELSLKLHVPPQDLIDMLLTQELRKLHRDRQAPVRYTTSQTPKIRYYSRRLPVKSKPPVEDMDREDFLDIIGVETISNEYPIVQRPMKTSPSSDRIPLASKPPANPGPVKIPSPAGRRENLFLSELNKMPLKRQSDGANDEDEDDEDGGDVEDEVTTYLAAKILTEYPNTIAKRDTQAQLKGQFPYELYERAMKDYLGQADTALRPVAKRESEVATEERVMPTEVQGKEETPAKTSAPQTVNEEEEGHREMTVAGM